MRTRKNLREYQSRAILRIARHKATGLFVDMALGKTAITLTAIKNMLDLDILQIGALVVAPGNVTKNTWQDEAKLWSHLKDMTFILVEGKPAERLRLLQQPADVHLISYTLLPWLGRQVKPNLKRRPWLADMLVLDESEYVKGRGAWFKAIKNRLIKWMPYRVIQTGTPAAHSLFDLWGQVYVLDRGARLGTAFERFRGRFFIQEDYQGYKFEPRPGAEKRIYSLINDVIIRLDAADWLKLPAVVPPPPYNQVFVDLPPRARRLYETHERDMFIRLDNLKEVEAVNAAVLSGQVWQLAQGAIYDSVEDRTSWSEIHTVKLDALRELLTQAVGNPVVIAYWFRHDRERLMRAYPKATFVNTKNVTKVEELWNLGLIEHLFINPGSTSHGLNLQFGGHIVLWFTQIWSPSRHLQLIGRLKRSDQSSPHIISRYLTARNTVDEVIAESRTRRLRGQTQLLEALRDYAKRKAN